MNLQITFQTKFVGDVIVWGSFQLFLSIREPFTFHPEYKYIERRNFESETFDIYNVIRRGCVLLYVQYIVNISPSLCLADIYTVTLYLHTTMHVDNYWTNYIWIKLICLPGYTIYGHYNSLSEQRKGKGNYDLKKRQDTACWKYQCKNYKVFVHICEFKTRE